MEEENLLNKAITGKRKLYKLPLDSNYKKQMVSKQTYEKWIKKAKCVESPDVTCKVNSSKNITESKPVCNKMEPTNMFLTEEQRISEVPSIASIVTELTTTSDNAFSNNSDDCDIQQILTDCSNEIIADKKYAEEVKKRKRAERRKTKEKPNEELREETPKEIPEETRRRLLTENRIMFHESGTTVGDVLEMIMALSCRYNFVLEARQKLFECFKICAGPEFCNVKITNYMFSKVFDPPEDKIKLLFYCTKCSGQLLVTKKESFATQNLRKTLCDKCCNEYEVSLNSPNYFLIVDLKYQITELLKNKGIATAIVEAVHSRKPDDFNDTISDIKDGLLHRRIVQKYPNAVTLNFGTDGAAAKNPLKCKTAFWPIPITINELPISMRYKFIVLVGIMTVTREPNPELLNLFLQKCLVEQALELSKEEIPVQVNGNTHFLRFFLFCASVDSVARALIQNRVKYNGYFGCSFCYIEGKYSGGAVRYPFAQLNSIRRSSVSHEKDLQKFLTSNSLRISRGVKGPSTLTAVEEFDIVWSFCFDYLHTFLLGPVHDMANTNFHFSRAVINIIDARLMTIVPSHEVHKAPQLFSDRSVWKADLWRSWALFFSLPICEDLLPPNVLENYALLVKSLYTLLKEEICVKELDECGVDLEQFICGYEDLYGVNCMKFNIHMISHIVECTKLSGPIAKTSTFPYEGYNGLLKNLVSGSRGINFQMARKSISLLLYRTQTRDYFTSPVVKAFCNMLFSEKKFTVPTKVKNGIAFFGPSEISVNEDTAGAQIFKKCIFEKQTYHSVQYQRVTKHNDTIVQLENGSMAQILEIIDMPNEGDCYLLVWILEAEKMIVGSVEMSHIWKVTGLIEKTIVPFKNVISKIILLEFDDKTFICKPPNVIEHG